MSSDDQPTTSAADALSIPRAIDNELTHVWMIRTFLKHADEAEEDEDLREVVRDLYDFILAVGPVNDEIDPKLYKKMAKKKLKRLRGATELYEAIQPEVSGHTNFVMAARSLRLAVDRIAALVQSPG
ncbi:amidohydrolase [Rhodopirellula sp. JC740]|uniref:Amidohydrolase n=1 Tax=Rhodopirellula halodulae TaxID=2894198 RepID=A0ABS8NLR6_9BACT|nr:amidohydrolase [Rhodopirellula sp. JC740]MCC9644519.1 amidohydrolase [Rhodopirellula sp. JC740]